MASKKEISRGKIEKILAEYPDRVPVLVRPEKSDKTYRFLVDENITIMNFLVLLRSKIKMDSSQGIYIFIQTGGEAILPPTSSTMGTIYHEYKNSNLVLNLVYAKENVFG